jgi:hypothetical protein
MIVNKHETMNVTIWHVSNTDYSTFSNEIDILAWCTTQFGNIDKLGSIWPFNKGWSYVRQTFIFHREQDVALFLLVWS